MPDVPASHPDFGRAQRCPHCRRDYTDYSGLTPTELAYTSENIKGPGNQQTALRYLVDYIVAHPVGMLTLWGNYGTAKSMTVQAIIAGLVRTGRDARFYHAKQVENGWFRDIHDPDHSAQGQLFLNTPIVAIDELDKVNLKNEWITQQFQALFDHRYRLAVAGKQLTLVTLNRSPEAALPGDIASRMNDGRFFRPWSGGANPLVVERWGEKVLPGCLEIKGKDLRPYVAPAFVEERHATKATVQP